MANNRRRPTARERELLTVLRAIGELAESVDHTARQGPYVPAVTLGKIQAMAESAQEDWSRPIVARRAKEFLEAERSREGK